MPVNDQDIDLLETYLDDEMSVADVNGLRARLVVEPELAKTLGALRAGRALRKSVFASMELSDAGAVRLLQNVKDTARRDYFRSRFNTYSRYVAAAAACVVIGFTTGWLGRSGGSGLHVGFGPAPSGNNVTQTTPVNNEFERPPSPNPGPPPAMTGNPISLTIADGQGRVVDVYRFGTQQEANRFINEFRVWKEQHKSSHNIILPGAAEQF